MGMSDQAPLPEGFQKPAAAKQPCSLISASKRMEAFQKNLQQFGSSICQQGQGAEQPSGSQLTLDLGSTPSKPNVVKREELPTKTDLPAFISLAIYRSITDPSLVTQRQHLTLQLHCSSADDVLDDAGIVSGGQPSLTTVACDIAKQTDGIGPTRAAGHLSCSTTGGGHGSGPKWKCLLRFPYGDM